MSVAYGSTLHSTWVDANDTGQLGAGPGEPLVDRTKLGETEPLTCELARIVHLTDVHVMDPCSPARVPFLARYGPPVQSTFRPQEALTSQVLLGAIHAIRAMGPELVLQGGDVIDNAQNNELECALALLCGGDAIPAGGPGGYYYGVQARSNPDPFYYRPDIDLPHHPRMLERAAAPLHSPGLGIDWLPVLGDHDALVQGELVPSPTTRSLALGDRALWEMPTTLRLPPELKLGSSASPGGPPDSNLVESFVAQALAGTTVQVPANPGRYELDLREVIERLVHASRAAAQELHGDGPASEHLDYVRDVGESLRVIVLDLVRRAGGSGGLVRPGQPAWLEQQLSDAEDRWVIVVTHQPLEDAEGGAALFDLLDRSPCVIAALAGHTHRNRIIPRETAAGGYWLITTCSLIDFPQQCRALTVHATRSGGVALTTWMLDHVENGPLGQISRELSYLDARGGRAIHLTGTRWDRNARLFRRAVTSR